jgi:hypothetical protein
MKLAFFSFLLLAIILIGCDDKPISPVESDSHSYNLIKLPPKSGFQVETIFSKTELIDGEKGGDIKIKESYETADGRKIKIDGKLKIKKHSFVGEVYITFTIDDQYAAASFSPEMVFDIPAELDLKFEGLDLQELNLTEGDYDFVYIDDNGNIEIIQRLGLHVKEDKGKIWVHKALLNHFSRYAFTR